MSESFKRYSKYAIYGLIGFIVLLIILSSCGNRYSKIESEMINKSKSYLDYSLNYVTLEDMNLKYDNCRPYSGVYYNGNNYTAYLFCDDYSSVSLTSKNITLFGNNPTILESGEIFLEPGYSSKYSIEVSKNIGESKGLYFVNYVAKNNGQIIDEIKRLVIIRESSNDSFRLKDKQEINVFKGEPYEEPGFIARDQNGNDISSYVYVSGSVNTKVAGQYEITYTLSKDGVRKELKRTIRVLDLTPYIELESTKPSSSSNNISLLIAGKDYSHTILPDGSTSNEREIEYQAKSNGTYSFKIYAGNEYVLKTIVVNNIYEKIVASCTLSKSNEQVVANVAASGGYGTLKYSYLDKDNYSTYTSEKTYYFKNIIKETKVRIKDEADNITTISCSNPDIKIGNLEIHFIANGHYDDAILIRTDDKTIFIDGGRTGCYKDDINYLKGLGVTKIDYLIGSHVEYDHIQAQAYILDEFQVGRILYPVDIYTCLSTSYCENPEDSEMVLKALSRNNKVAETVSIPSKIVVGDMTLYFIAPWNKVKNNNNNNSFIFILTYGINSFMFTGDTYSPLNNLTTLENYAHELGLNSIDVDVFKYPHHGNNPMYDKILNKINPEIIVVPNFHASKYPTEENKALINSRGIKMYRQSDSSTGNITLISDGTKISVYMNSSASTYKR